MKGQRVFGLLDGRGIRWAALRGNVSDETLLREAAIDMTYGSESEALVIEHRHFIFHSHIKNCDARFGWGCDLDGEWHSHWEAARPSADTEWTLVRLSRGPVTEAKPFNPEPWPWGEGGVPGIDPEVQP